MGDVYGSAHHVIIWLNKTIDLGLLHRYSELDWWKDNEGVIATCEELGSNMYWKRAWIAQEITKPDDIQIWDVAACLKWNLCRTLTMYNMTYLG